MDPIMMDKFQAMKRYKRKEFLPTLIHYLESILVLGLFLSCPLWLTVVCSSLKAFFLVSVPKMWAAVFGPKCLFIVCNIIIVFLVGESKLTKSSPSPDIYQEYAEQSKCLHRLPSTTGEAKEEEEEISVISEKALQVEEREEEKDDQKAAEERGGEDGEEENVEQVCEEMEGDQEDRGLPADELNKRVEDFIAKINMQRRLEARMVVCCG